MHLNDLHRHLNTLASTPQSVPTWRSLVEALKSQQLVATLATSSDQDKIDIATKLYDIVQIHDLGLQETFFGVDHIKSIIENETIVALANKIELYLKRNALPTEDTATGTPKPSRKERWTNRRNKNKKDDDEPLLENTEPKKSRKERLEEAVAPVVEKRREGTDSVKKNFNEFTDNVSTRYTAIKDATNNRIDGLKTRKNNLAKSAKKNFNEFSKKSKKALDTFWNGPDLSDFTVQEQGQIGLLGDYAKHFLEDPAHAGEDLTDLMLCDYAKSQRHISFRKAYQYLLTLQKAGILTISRYRGIIEIEGVTRPQKVVRDMNNDLTSLESYLIRQLNGRKAPTYNELWTWFVDERYGGKDKQPRGLFNDEKLLFSELLNQLVKEGFIITRGRGDKTTYHKGPKFRTHTVAPAQTSHASDNEALDVVYAQMDTKTLQLETRVYTEVLQALKKILENHTKTPTLNGTQLTLLTDAIQLYETQADQLNQINPYTLLTLFDEIDAPIPPLLWEWKNTLEKAYIDHIRQEEVVSHQPRIKAYLLSQFTSNTLRDKLATKYIVVAYEEDDIPSSLKSIFITQVLPYFRECAGALGTTRQYEASDITTFIVQCMEQDIARELAREGIYMPDTTTTIDEGIVTKSGRSMHRFQSAEAFVQALTLKKNATEQEEFIDELAYPDMHLNHLQKRPATTKVDHGTGLKGLKRKFSTAVSSAFADDTPTAKEKEYKDTLSETYLEHCTPHLYTRTIDRNETVQIDQETGTITYMLHGHQTTCIVDRKKPEEAMTTIAMESSNSRNDEEKAKIIKALLKSYAENLVDTDGPQKFINKAGEPCIITIEAEGKVVIYINGNKRNEPFVNGDETSYQNLLVFRSYISSAMEQFIPLDQRLHADKKAATGSVSLPSRSAERNAFNRSLGLSTTELVITTGKIITTPGSTRKVRDSSAAGGYREEQVAAKEKDAEMILIPAAEELIDKSNAGQHIFTLPGSLTTFWKERTFIRFAEKVIEVKYIDTLANQKRYEVIAAWDSREKVYDDVDMNALLNKEIEHMGSDQAIAHMQPLVSFIIPEQHGTDAAQVYYFNPETQERFKGEDKDGHPGISDRDLGDFAADIRSGNVLERGPELKVRVQAFATDKKGRMNRSRFERERITKRPHTLKMRKLEDTQIPRVLKESLHAKKAINDALAACLARLS